MRIDFAPFGMIAEVQDKEIVDEKDVRGFGGSIGINEPLKKIPVVRRSHKRWENTGVRYAFGNEMIRVGCLKGYADGSLGSTTAWFFDPYLDDPKTVGLAGDEIPKTPDYVMAADKAGLQINIHAIGDRANDEILDIFERTAAANGPRDRRFRIEHAQHLRQEDIRRFAGLKVVASMQPFHIIDDGRWAWKRLDEKRLKGTYAFRTLLDSGGVLAFGSDSPVAPLNPLLGVYAAVTRRTTDVADAAEAVAALLVPPAIRPAA